MDPKPNWSFKKGNIDMKVTKSGTPIPKEGINDTILSFIYEKFPNDARLLMSSNFTIEFICVEKTTAFIKINVKGVNKKTVEVKLTGNDAEEFVNLVGNSLNPPHSQN